MRHALARLCSLGRDDSGVTAIEFALVSPMLFLMIMGIVEFSLIFFASGVIENATVLGARAGLTGDAGSVNNRTKYIQDFIKQNSAGLLDPNKVVINAAAYDDYSSANAGSKISGKNFGTGNQTALYKVTYPWTLYTPLIAQFFEGRTYTITSTAIVKNEAF